MLALLNASDSDSGAHNDILPIEPHSFLWGFLVPIFMIRIAALTLGSLARTYRPTLPMPPYPSEWQGARTAKRTSCHRI